MIALYTTLALFLSDAAVPDQNKIVTILPSAETTPVKSADDAADDPALWLHPTNPEQSLILGTDKKAGLAVYRLDGTQIDFVPSGRVNNVDIIQNVRLDDWSGDLAAASNRSGDNVTLFSIDAEGTSEIGKFSVAPEPYGFCMGRVMDKITLFVAHKQGYVQPYELFSLMEPPVARPPLYVESQIEGCVYDEAHQTLFVGEEEKGIWAVPYTEGGFQSQKEQLIDTVGSKTGLTADVEGMTLYDGPDGTGYIIASSQGDDTYQLYTRTDGYQFVGKFRIGTNKERGIDGTQETDGIHAASYNLGSNYPRGMMIIQDGYNVSSTDLAHDGRRADEIPLTAQNFKIIDWRDIEAGLKLLEK